MRSFIAWFALILILILYFSIGGFYTAMSGVSSIVIAGVVVVFVSFWWLGVAAHEFGHALCARAGGSTIHKIGIGPIALEWSEPGTIIRRNRGLPGFSGFVQLSKSDYSKPHWRRSFFWFFLAGPFAEALFGIVVFTIAVSFIESPTWLKSTLIAVAVCHWLGTVMSLIPIRIGLIGNDGSRLKMLLRGGSSAEALRQSFQWTELVLTGDAPGNWPAEIIDAQERALMRSGELHSDDLDLAIQAGYFLYLHYADRHEWTEASHVLTRAVELPHRENATKATGRFDLVDLLSAIHLSLRGRNGLAAQAALDRVGSKATIRKNSLATGAAACIDLAMNRQQAALLLAGKARRMLERAGTELGADLLEASWWDEVIELAQRSHQSTSPVAAPSTKLATPLPQLGIGATRHDPATLMFSWDPGVASDTRTAWILRRPITDYDLRA